MSNNVEIDQQMSVEEQQRILQQQQQALQLTIMPSQKIDIAKERFQIMISQEETQSLNKMVEWFSGVVGNISEKTCDNNRDALAANLTSGFTSGADKVKNKEKKNEIGRKIRLAPVLSNIISRSKNTGLCTKAEFNMLNQLDNPVHLERYLSHLDVLAVATNGSRDKKGKEARLGQIVNEERKRIELDMMKSIPELIYQLATFYNLTAQQQNNKTGQTYTFMDPIGIRRKIKGYVEYLKEIGNHDRALALEQKFCNFMYVKEELWPTNDIIYEDHLIERLNVIKSDVEQNYKAERILRAKFEDSMKRINRASRTYKKNFSYIDSLVMLVYLMSMVKGSQFYLVGPKQGITEDGKVNVQIQNEWYTNLGECVTPIYDNITMDLTGCSDSWLDCKSLVYPRELTMEELSAFENYWGDYYLQLIETKKGPIQKDAVINIEDRGIRFGDGFVSEIPQSQVRLKQIEGNNNQNGGGENNNGNVANNGLSNEDMLSYIVGNITQSEARTKDHVEDKLGNTIQSIESTLASQFQALNESAAAMTIKGEKKIEEEINSLAKDMTSDIDLVRADLDKMEKELNKEIIDLQNKIEKDNSELIDSISKSTDKVNESIRESNQEVIKKLESEEEKLESFIKELEDKNTEDINKSIGNSKEDIVITFQKEIDKMKFELDEDIETSESRIINNMSQDYTLLSNDIQIRYDVIKGQLDTILASILYEIKTCQVTLMTDDEKETCYWVQTSEPKCKYNNEIYYSNELPQRVCIPRDNGTQGTATTAGMIIPSTSLVVTIIGIVVNVLLSGTMIILVMTKLVLYVRDKRIERKRAAQRNEFRNNFSSRMDHSVDDAEIETQLEDL